jgi:4-amino-4-deoxy-L-arabinose transferase-like glycosyltransferase
MSVVDGEHRAKGIEQRDGRGLMGTTLLQRVAPWVVALVLLVAALWIRLYRLDAQPLWLDEGATWATVTGNRLGALLRDLFRPTQAYPLYHVLMKLDTRLLGDGAWALRLPSAVAGALAVPAIYALGRELRGEVLGLGAAVLLLVSPFAIWQAQDAKAYSLTLLVTILLALTLARAIRRATPASWLAFALAALVAPFVHRLLLFSLLGAAVVWALTATHRYRRRVLAGALVAALGVVGALVVSLRAQSAGGQYSGTGALQALWLTFGQFATGQWPGAVRRLWLLPFALLTLLGGGKLLLDLRRSPRARGPLLILVLGGLPTLLLTLLLLFQPMY